MGTTFASASAAPTVPVKPTVLCSLVSAAGVKGSGFEIPSLRHRDSCSYHLDRRLAALYSMHCIQ